MKKLTKTQVKAQAKKLGNVTVWLCPSNCLPDPNNPLTIAIQKAVTANDVLSDKFDNFISTFSYYNCNKETGKTVHYYIL